MTDRGQYPNEQTVRRYLLGQASPRESEEIDQALLYADSFGDLVSAIEDELTEEYVTNDLTEIDRGAFEKLFLSNADRLTRIRVTALLLKRDDVLDTLNWSEAKLREVNGNVFSRQDHQSPGYLGEAIIAKSRNSDAWGAAVNLSSTSLITSEAYLQRLSWGENEARKHFIMYFGPLIREKLRSQLSSPEAIESVARETLERALASFRTGGKPDPENLVEFVNSVCNNVLLGRYRSFSKTRSVAQGAHASPSPSSDRWVFMGTTSGVKHYLQEIFHRAKQSVRRTIDRVRAAFSGR